MTAPTGHVFGSEVRVQAERLAGIGWRYIVPADMGRQVVVVVEDSGPVHLVLADPRLDAVLTTVRLPAGHASVLAALLTGARFIVEAPEASPRKGTPDPEEVVIETVHIAAGSPALGRAPDDVVQQLGSDAVLLGVICDATPQLVETDERRGVQVRDRLVVAARRGRLEQLRSTV